MSTTLLAVETSCDETSAAVLRGHGEVLSHIIASQAETHAAYGGVVPEVASRSHLEALPSVIGGALQSAGLRADEIDAFAATTSPGLAPALLIGASVAKGLALGAARPFLAMNHLEGHLLSPFFGLAEVPAHTAMIVSGGHTLLFDVTGFGRYELLGRTLDDAAGEAFDKVAKLLGLGYPGGAEIDRLARSGDGNRFEFPRGMQTSPDLNFSFSGLKTAVRVFLEKGFEEKDLPDICASFQEAVVDVLVSKLRRAARQKGRTIATLSGGVSSNARLQARARERLEREGIELRLAGPELRTDNALMIAYAASLHCAHGDISSPTADIRPDFDPVLLCR